jgi:hypothetical protein
MVRIIRVVVLVTALLSAVAATASSAAAVMWHNSGSMAFTATGQPGTFSVTPTDCTYDLTFLAQVGSVTTSTVDVTCGVYQFNTKI